ncbi:D-alanyl-D-alanine carboxypeptidase/D-alanyl-D-alanine-endopeptidase [Candidatus Poriferisodalis sp.]|uniref:D-alanyl-D-alanine carboxypeptidase/D-alanyl-D-alanine-endopeptidase n=1 Tax=Candidatus Poriferisodalis sp. TaxID=3101277 RepID=UPI003B0266DC
MKRLASRLGIARGTCTNRCVLAAVLMAVLTAVVALAGAVPVGAQGKQRDDRLADDFAALLSRRDTPANTCMSVSVDGEQIIGHRDTVGMVPASLTKLATMAAAIELMGADEQFVTTVAVRADDLAAVRDGVLHGDVYLIGGGDPVLATPRYMRRLHDERPFTDADMLADAAMAALSSQGVRVVDGAVVGDGSRYPDNERDYTAHEVTDPAEGASAEVWKQSYRTTNLVGPLGGLTLNDGYRHHRSNRRAHVRSPDPAQGAASVFDDLLEARGLVIRDRPRAGAAPGKTVRVELALISSPPLGSIVGRIGRYSENTAAEMLLKEIGHRTVGSSRAQAVAGATAVLWGALGEVAGEIGMADGSGLSVHNTMTCRAAVALLERTQRGDPIFDSLAIAGRTGTLQRCSPSVARNSAELHPVHAKGGILNNVVAVAGRVDARSGRQLAFAVISNAPLLIGRGSCPALRRIPITAAARFDPTPPESTHADVSFK